MAMYTYTLVFINIKSNIVMINRNKTPWMGMWNGLGGKIKEGETPLQSIQREIQEELGVHISFHNILERGILTWNTFEADGQGIHLFYVELDQLDCAFPIQMDEGIIDLKHIDWITHLNNKGVAPNIKYFLPQLISSKIHVHCHFENEQLEEVVVKPL